MKSLIITLTLIIIILMSFTSFTDAVEQDKKSPKGPAKKSIFTAEATTTEPFHLGWGNLCGGRTKLDVSGKAADSELRIKLGVEQEDIFGSDCFIGSDFHAQSIKDDRYDKVMLGQDLYIGKSFSDKTEVKIKYFYKDVKISDLEGNVDNEIKKTEGTNSISLLSTEFEYSTLDNKRYPRSGNYFDIIGQCANDSLGGDYDFLRLTGHLKTYKTWQGWLTSVYRIKVGWVSDYGSSSYVPFYERFYVGSSGTIRGYEARVLGPRDRDGRSLGGEAMILNNFEVRFPMVGNLNGALFFDAGNTWEDLKAIDLGEWKTGIGLGLRYLTPFGVARVDYGYGLDGKFREKAGRVHITLGIPF